jgi:EAL domain-containing protein (putative c-di-GMP-specific phosphodiesterase class I)
VNAHGKVFERILHANSIPTERVVIEIQEGLVDQDKQLTEAIDNYRDRGYRIAIDNFGSTHSHIDRLWKFSPELVKLDLNLIQKAEHNERVRKLLPGLIKIIRDLGAQPVITGIENQAQLEIAVEAGSTLLQGYFLGKPAIAKDLQPSKLFKSAASRSTIRAAA